MKDTVYGRMPIWKWILFAILGIAGFTVIYSLFQAIAMLPHEIWLRILVSILAAAAIFSIYVLWCRMVEKSRADELTTRKGMRDVLLGILVGVCFFGVIVIVMYALGYYRIATVKFDFTRLAFAFAFYIFVAVSEEIIFRGVLFKMIDRRWNALAAYLVSAVVFGAAHIMQPNGTLWTSFAIAIEAGIMLGAAYKFSGTLWLPIGIHLAWNFTEGSIFGFAVSGSNSFSTLISPILQGPKILTGGDFGPEGSMITVVLGAALSAIFILKTLKSSSQKA